MESLFHSPTALFTVQAVLIVTSARLLGLLAKRVEQPLVIAEVVAGILLGPSLLGWLAPGASAVLFPKQSLAALGLVAQVGLSLFMFLIGLELDPKLLRGRGRASVAISHSSIVAPFSLGALLALYLYPRLSSPGVSFTAFALFMGAAMSVTAFPVLARILSERRLLRSKVGALTITCAAVDDVTAWCILAFVVAVVRTTGITAAIRTTLLAVGYILLMVKVVRPLLQRLAARSSTREALTQNTVAATLVVLLLSSLATELIGIHALFGAFLLGAIIPKDGVFAPTLAERLEDLVVVLLLPMFFAYSGLRTQIGLLDTAEAWGMCGLIVLVACFGKFGGSVLAARLVGLRWREASAIGILMNTRGLMELIVLNIGLDLGVITPKLFAMLVLMALITTFITTPLLSWVYPPTELAKELAELTTDEDKLASPAPLPAPEFTVLMCVSLDRSGPGMVTLAAALAGKRAARLYALRLLRASERSSFHVPHGSVPSTDALTPLLSRSQELGLSVHPLSFVSAHPGRDIVDVGAVKHAELLLLGWHKPVLSGNALGGTVREVMRAAQADVGVLVDRGLQRIERVLVPYLGSPHDQAALLLGKRLQQSGAALTVLHILTSGKSEEHARIEQLIRGSDANESGDAAGPPVTVRVAESTVPSEAAIREAAQGYDLMIVGVGPEWGLDQHARSTHSEQIISSCSTSLLVVRCRPSTANPHPTK